MWLFGTTLEAELEKATENADKPRKAEAARQRVLNKWFPPKPGEKGRFRDPAVMM